MTRPTVDPALQQAFEKEVMVAATGVATPSGLAWVTDIRLAEFFQASGYQELYAEEGFFDALPALAPAGNEYLVDFLLDDTGPGMSWTWHLGRFRVNDRGYIYLWNEPDVEMGEPVLGIWEPYDNALAFEACFVATYKSHVELIGIATKMHVIEPVSVNLMATALWAAVQNGTEYMGQTLLEHMQIREDDPTKVTLDQVRQFLIESARRFR